MLKFEYNMLVLNNAFSEDDVDQINAYADYVRSQERERIIKLLEDNFAETVIQADFMSTRIQQTFSTDVIALIKGEN